MIKLNVESQDFLRAAQLEMEQKYSKQNCRKVVLKELREESPEITNLMVKAREHILKLPISSYYDSKRDMYNDLLEIEEESDNTAIMKFLENTMVAVLLGGRIQEFTAVVGQCLNDLPWDKSYDEPLRLKRMGEMLVHMCDNDLFDIAMPDESDEGVLMITNRWALEDETIELIALTKFLPPMVCPPNEIKNDKQTGYLQSKAQVMSKWWNQNRGSDDLRYDFLNKRNATAYTLDIPYLKAMEDTLDIESDDVDPADVEAIEEEWKRYQLDTKKIACDVHNRGNGKHWYNTFYCNRGRVYARGYHLSYQGNSHRKAMVNFADTCEMSGVEEYSAFFK